MPENRNWTLRLQTAFQSLHEVLSREIPLNPIAERESILREDLRNLDKLLKREASHEMDKFIRLVCESGYLAKYKAHFIIVRYHYVVKGVRIVVSDCGKRYRLPGLKGSYYWVTWDVQKYIDAGWEVEDRI
jgi:hypothetical protein